MNRTILRTILAVCKETWKTIAVILVVGVSQTFIGMYAIVYFQRLIDQLLTAKALADLSAPLAGYIALNVTNHILIYLEGYPNSLLKSRVYQWVKLRALEKIARIDYLAYQDIGTGNLVQNIENGAAATRDILTGFYLVVVREVLPGMIISLAFIRYYDQTLFLIILSSYALFYLVSYSLMRFLRRETENMLANQEDFSKFSVRAFMELVVFRINGRFKAEFERVRGISDEIVRSRAKIYLLQELFFTGFAMMIFIVQAAVVIQQAGKIIAGTSTVGTLVALIEFIHIVYFPISGFSLAWMGYRLNAVTFERFHTFFALPEDSGLERGAELAISAGQVEFENVSFAYAGNEVLRGFHLSIPGGRTTAIVGASGGGKSTLVRLLLHLIKPQQGQVCVDGQDLARVKLSSYYTQVAYIPQEPPIFDGTLRENLVFERPAPTARLDEVIRMVGLAEVVRRLPKGLDTLIGERGVKLSGGERQRLAFGRVLLQDPRIVILDEPTSALDSLTEDFITHNLIPFLAGKTVIIVAHRLQTVRAADQIVVLENGQIVQTGRFEALAAAPGRFRQLWEKQSREAVDAEQESTRASAAASAA